MENITRYPVKSLNQTKYLELLKAEMRTKYSKRIKNPMNNYETFVERTISIWKECGKKVFLKAENYKRGNTWFNEEIKLKIKLGNKARKTLYLKTSFENIEIFRKYKIETMLLIKNGKTRFWKKVSENRDLDIINKLLRNSKRIKIEQEVHSQDTQITTATEVSRNYAKTMSSIDNKDNSETKIKKKRINLKIL